MPPRPPSLRTLFRRPPTLNPHLPHPPKRLQSTTPPPKTPHTRHFRILSRLPPFLQPYTRGLLNAPVSHITSFLILHELTAVVPLLGLATLFHYTNWLPKAWAEGRWISQGVETFGRYFGRKAWFGFEREVKSGVMGEGGGDGGKGEIRGTGNDEMDEKEREKGIEERWHVGEKGSKILVEVATAYAITKVFLPARILLSVWCTPWFARAIIGRFWGLFGRGKSGSTVAKSTETITKNTP